jgi:hypothetical protein
MGGAGGAGASTGTGGATGAGGFPSPYLFYDAFETNADIGLFAGGPSTTPHVLSPGGATPGSSYHLNISGGDGYFQGMNYEFAPAIRPSVVRYWVRIPSTGQDGYFVLSESATGPAGSFAYLWLQYFQYQAPAMATVLTDNPSWRTTMDGNGNMLLPNTWYHIEIDFNWSSKTTTFKINDVALEPVGVFTAGGIARLDIFTVNGGGDFDEIEMLP